MNRVTSTPTVRSDVQRRAWLGSLSVLALLVGASRPVLAHASSLGGSRESMTVPAWLVLLTGGAVIGASFLLMSMVTDRRFIDRITDAGPAFAVAPSSWLTTGGRLVGLAVLVVLVVVGLWGPQTPAANLTVLFVWALWWAGYAMTVYVVGNTWPAVNPWRLVAETVTTGGIFRYPDRLGSWPSLVGLFALIWVEVTTQVTDRPALLATIIAIYSILTTLGAIIFGAETWFARADPISRVFAYFGSIAPVQRTASGVEIGLPGWHLVDGDLVSGWDDVAFVVGMLWLTTYDGFVATPTWKTIVSVPVSLGVPPLLAYFALVAGGFALFVVAFVYASRVARRVANTTLDSRTLAFAFAQSLLPIAAGYHLAHYLGYFVHFLPSAVVLAGQPFAPPALVPVVVVPDWFGTLELGFVLLGHVIAIWVAHGVAFATFTGRLQPIRSQYPYSLVMILYTMVSVGIVYQPSIAPPYL